MKVSKKILFLLMTIILIMVSMVPILGQNQVQAATLPITKADLYSKGEVVLFEYDNIGIGVEVIVYKKDGVEYPAYCVNKGRPGVTEEHGYSVSINQMLANQKIWRAVVNGYPFKTPEELGCKTMEEAYAATKMAVYDAMYHYDLKKFTIHRDLDSNRRVVAAIKKIITAARNSTETKIAAILQIKEVTQNWQVDNIDPNYISKTYSVKASAANKTYQISLTGENSNRFKVTDMQNKEKTEFATTEKFKVLLPIADLEQKGEFEITAYSKLETKPVLYGETPNPEWQNFAVTAGTYEETDVTLKQTYQENKTKIEIQKQDGDTKKPLSNAVFHLLDANKQVLYTELTTNKEGVINLDYLLPGTYYLEEVQSPDGYYGYEELIPIEVGFQEKVVVKVDNYKEEEEKPEDKPQDEYHFSVGEKKLPRTGF